VDRQVPIPGGRLEYAVLATLWTAGRLTAREIHERVGGPLDLVYTTTTRVLDRLHAKGLVDRRRRDGVFVYKAAIARSDVERARISQTLGALFGAQPRPAMASLVDAIEALDPALLDELARTVAARRRSR
jgi:predicted transcriptional regulator